MVVFDTNAVLRYILQDNDEMADTVEKQMRDGGCFIPPEMIAEMVYVLSKVYRVSRKNISTAVIGVLSIENISTTNYAVAVRGLEVYATTNLDFIDCLMSGYRDFGYTVFTFDKALKKYFDKR
jgi:predicted nucleic-acid-binding protein